jgi:hypothetical protein
MRKTILAALATTAFSTVAHAAVVDLTFEGINAVYPSTNYAFIQSFYDGGMSSQGTSGTNYGISFSSNAQAICLNTPGNVCSNTSRGGFGDPNSQRGGLFFLSGSDTFMDDPAGFTSGFSLEYVAANEGGSLGVYSGVDGTGTLLASINLPVDADSGVCYSGSGTFCPFSPVGVDFAGTAESIDFAGVENQIVFDDVTFGSSTVGGGTPEPATWATMLAGLAATGAMLRRRRTLASA